MNEEARMQDVEQPTPEDERPDPQTPPEVPPEPNEPIQERSPGRNDPDGEEIWSEAPLA